MEDKTGSTSVFLVVVSEMLDLSDIYAKYKTFQFHLNTYMYPFSMYIDSLEFKFRLDTCNTEIY